MAIVVEQASEGTLTSLLSQLRSSNNFFLPTLNQRNLQGFLTSHNLRYVQTRLTNFLSRCSPVFALGIVYQNLDPTYPATECVQGLDTGSPKEAQQHTRTKRSLFICFLPRVRETAHSPTAPHEGTRVIDTGSPRTHAIHIHHLQRPIRRDAAKEG